MECADRSHWLQIVQLKASARECPNQCSVKTIQSPRTRVTLATNSHRVRWGHGASWWGFHSQLTYYQLLVGAQSNAACTHRESRTAGEASRLIKCCLPLSSVKSLCTATRRVAYQSGKWKIITVSTSDLAYYKASGKRFLPARCIYKHLSRANVNLERSE